MAIELLPLPYDSDALAPHISEKTMKFHHGKHHKSYVEKTNKGIEGTKLDGRPLEEIIEHAARDNDTSLFNPAAQVWNHNFFWQSMSPEKTSPSEEMSEAIEKAFGDLDGFRQAFKECATGQFGSGWAWLVAGDDGLEVMSTSDADLPLIKGPTPLLTCDVWEHAYYLDYQNERGKFVEAFLENLINWDFAAENLKQAGQRAAAVRSA